MFVLGLSAVLAMLLTSPVAASPNVVFFLVDDLGWRDVSYNGSSFYETPNIDRLAASGMRFTQGYAACPVCSPTRASIMTGKYPVRTRITDYISQARNNQPDGWQRNTELLPAEYADRLALEEVTMAEAFREGGYATYFAGKWHLGPEGFYPEDQGFDVNVGGFEAGAPFRGGGYFPPYENPRLPDGPAGEHLPDRLARETVGFIQQHRDEPFFAYLSFYSVHTPLMTRPALERKYEAKAATIAFHGPRFLPEAFRESRRVQDHAIFAGMIEAMDSAVGGVLDALVANGLESNTIVAFMSDNGGTATSEGHPTSNLPLRAGKGWLYEGGIREPWIIRAPQVTAPGSVESTPVSSVDFYPTLLELAGLRKRPEQHVDGASLVPLLRGETQDRGPLYWHYPHYSYQGGAPGAAILDGDWKLIKRYEDGELELFHLSADIGEEYNLADLRPDMTQKLESQLDAWLAAVGAEMPTKNPSYAPNRPSGRLPPDRR